MNTIYPQTTSQRCRECGNFLMLIDRRTEIEEGQHSPVTVSIFHCSDTSCQEEIDRKTVLRIQKAKDQVLAREKRLETIRMNKMKAKMEATQELHT